MTRGEPPPPSDRTINGLGASSDQVYQDMEIIFRHVAGRPSSARVHDAVPPPSRRARAREAVPIQRRRRQYPAQVAVLFVLGGALLAFLVGALGSMERSSTLVPPVATQRPAETSRAATTTSQIEIGPIAETTLSPDAEPPLPRWETREGSTESARADAPAPPSGIASPRSEPSEPSPIPAASDRGQAVVRAFYAALGRGDGERASALVVAEKRSSRAYSPEAISRFYGRLAEAIRLTGLTPLAPGAYRVSYRYSAGRSRCDGEAVVSLTSRNGRDLIRSIRALNGC